MGIYEEEWRDFRARIKLWEVLQVQKTVILGNIITVDERRPFAKAAFVKDGVFAYIGDAGEAKKLAGADAKILDYGENFIYPGFLEPTLTALLRGSALSGRPIFRRFV